MKLTKLFMALAITSLFAVSGCKPKDSAIAADIESVLKSKPDMIGTSVSVKDGVATISGVCKDEVCKADCEKAVAAVKGVKSVVNNLTVAAPVFVPPTITPDDPLKQGVTDAIKDHPGVSADVRDGVITLTGEIKKDALTRLMMALNSLRPKKIENQLIIK